MTTKTNKYNEPVYLLLFNIAVLVVANILTIVFFVMGDYSLMQILLTYYIQTIFIVIFYYLRIQTIHELKIYRNWRGLPIWLQKYVAKSAAAKYQFLYLLVFVTPLIFLFYGFINTDAGFNSLAHSSVDYTYVLISSLLFLIHHIISYSIVLHDYHRGNTHSVDLPYVKLFVRVFTIYAITFLGLSIFEEDQANRVFIIFVVIKSLTDIVLSSTWFIWKSAKHQKFLIIK